MSNLGLQKHKIIEKLKSNTVVNILSELIVKSVVKPNTVIVPEVDQAIANLHNGDVLLLENVRFESGEETNDPALVEEFAKMADIFVNDAFGTSHRAHASTVGIAERLPAIAGFWMETEIPVLSTALEIGRAHV